MTRRASEKLLSSLSTNKNKNSSPTPNDPCDKVDTVRVVDLWLDFLLREEVRRQETPLLFLFRRRINLRLFNFQYVQLVLDSTCAPGSRDCFARLDNNKFCTHMNHQTARDIVGSCVFTCHRRQDEGDNGQSNGMHHVVFELF